MKKCITQKNEAKDNGQRLVSSDDEEEGTECTESLAHAAEKAASGIDLQSVALMGKTISDATQAASGGSASKAHKANASIQGGLSGIALIRYMKCTSAISNCEALCATKKVGEDCLRKFPQGPTGNEASRKQCDRKSQGSFREMCCSIICLQSVRASCSDGRY